MLESQIGGWLNSFSGLLGTCERFAPKIVKRRLVCAHLFGNHSAMLDHVVVAGSSHGPVMVSAAHGPFIIGVTFWAMQGPTCLITNAL